METAVRNLGREGVAATAIAAVDMALWDAKAKTLGCSLVNLLGEMRDEIDAYASGGFTSYSPDELRKQLARYVERGFSCIKMKIGDDGHTPERVATARAIVGPRVSLFVDANGAFTPKHALAMAERIAESDVRWFEEPCSSDDTEGLRFVRERAPAAMDVAAGEYGYRSQDFDRLLAAGAVDVLQADATRCGVTGFMRVAASCEARGVPLSAHCAPAIHAHLGCAAPRMVHVEYFHDHARIEAALMDGAAIARGGKLHPDRSCAGLGVELKRTDAERYRVFDAELGPRATR
jgi:L-alanine-DL-glutamate epimerase-like enolase superfamily enzyme